MAKKISLTRYGDHGWEWKLADGNQYRTGRQGDGLWHYEKTGSVWYGYDGPGSTSPVWEWKQISGTCQYGLPRGYDAAYSKLYRELYAEEE